MFYIKKDKQWQEIESGFIKYISNCEYIKLKHMENSLFNKEDNKYFKWYFNICENAKNRELSSDIYTEKHHFYPLSIFGKNDHLVKLTAKEHYIAHLCIWYGFKCKYGTKNIYTRKMAGAFSMMNKKSTTQQRYDSKYYEIVKIAYIESRKGRIVTEETKEKLSKAAKGRAPWNKGLPKEQSATWGMKHSQESIEKIRKANTGYKHTEESLTKMSKAKKGKTYSEIYGEEMKEKVLKKRSECMSGEKHHYFGKTRDEETRKKISDSVKANQAANPITLERRKILSDALKESWKRRKKLKLEQEQKTENNE